jgi:RimJ/RimL family protein N-acetyltransferase
MNDVQEGALVRLRDITLADADRFDEIQGAEKADGGFNDFGVPYKPVDRDVLTRGPLRNERNGVLLVERITDGRIVGTVGWHKVSYGPSPESQVWNFGIDIIADARGQGYGTEAQRLVAEYLFRTTPANRVEASTDIDNIAEQRSLQKAGFTREGIARGAQFRAGAYHDLVTYAKLRDDPR